MTPISQQAREAARVTEMFHDEHQSLEFVLNQAKTGVLSNPQVVASAEKELAGLRDCYATSGDVLRSNAKLRAERDELRRALQQFADCDLNDDNCASLEVATARIRGIARAALSPNQKGEHD